MTARAYVRLALRDRGLGVKDGDPHDPRRAPDRLPARRSGLPNIIGEAAVLAVEPSSR